MRPILKYPGSKWNIARRLVELIPEHHSYLEPYAGSLALLFNKPPSAIETINDLDSNVTNLFQCIQKDSERLARLVITTPFSREIYNNQFEGKEATRYASDFQRAAGVELRHRLYGQTALLPELATDIIINPVMRECKKIRS